MGASVLHRSLQVTTSACHAIRSASDDPPLQFPTKRCMINATLVMSLFPHRVPHRIEILCPESNSASEARIICSSNSNQSLWSIVTLPMTANRSTPPIERVPKYTTYNCILHVQPLRNHTRRTPRFILLSTTSNSRTLIGTRHRKEKSKV